jgi:hypothetical protein
MKGGAQMFKNFKEFMAYIITLESGLYRITYEMGEVEYWLLDVDNLRIRIVYDNYSPMSDVGSTKESDFTFMTFFDFANEEFYACVTSIEEL